MEGTDWMRLDVRASGSSLVNVVVDTPAGSRNKFKLDEDHGLFVLHKVLPVGMAFPFDFGFVPGTRGDDGDALDALVLGEEPTFTGCLVTVRLLGILEAKQTDKGRTLRNDRLIATPETSKIKPQARSLSDLPSELLDQIEHFFVSYNRAEGQEFVPIGRRGPRAAERALEAGSRRYRAAVEKVRGESARRGPGKS